MKQCAMEQSYKTHAIVVHTMRRSRCADIGSSGGYTWQLVYKTKWPKPCEKNKPAIHK